MGTGDVDKRPDLSLVSTDAMIEALLTRYDHAAFVGMKCAVSSSTGHLLHRKWVGNTHAVIGLLFDQACTALEDFRNRETRPPPEHEG